jgi:uncharacterized protein (TIGR03437 family)
MLAAAIVAASASSAAAAGFGTVVPIGGHAADIALDESRGVVYVANYTGNRIDVMSTADSTIHTSLNVAHGPASLALSPDSQFLVVTHYASTSTSDPTKNLVTIINLNGNTQQTFYTGDPPLGVAFAQTTPLCSQCSGQALIVTTTSFVTLDPQSGAMTVLDTIANAAQALPVASATFPGQITETALGTSGNGLVIWGVAGAGTGTEMVYRYRAGGSLSVWGFVTSPALLPRVSVSSDGSSAMIGYVLCTAVGQSGVAIAARYPNVITSANITGHAIDSAHNLIYGQFPDTTQPTGPPLASSTTSAGSASSTVLPALFIMDADNMTVRDRITIPENLVGRAVLNSAGTALYAISDSGLTVLPVGSLNQYNRLAVSQEDVFVQTNFCNRSTVVQTLTISDPGGGRTDFTITPSQSGVTVAPSAGYTPATVQVRVDPAAFQGSSGTTAVTLKVTSSSAVNRPPSVRVLMNNPDSDQRGTVVDVPGTLSDILPDPARNRFYILRQDKNQLLVFDGGTDQLVTALRTATSPTMMSFASNGYLMVGHNDSQFITVYDMDALQAQTPIPLPAGHFGRSIAQSNAALLVLSRDEGTGTGAIDVINLASGTSYELPTLGVYKNEVSTQGVLAASPNGATVVMAGADGNLMLYSADANTFTISRKDYTALSGAFAASSYNTYVVGNTVFNASLVPVATFSSSNGSPSGFAFVNQGGYMATTPAAAGAGVIQNVSNVTALSTSSTVKAVRTLEAPLLPVQPASSSTSTSTGTSTGTGTTTTTTTVSGYVYTAFARTVAPLSSAGTVVVLSTSGFTVLAANYDASVAAPTITSVVNAADGTQPVAPGGLISAYGQQMSPVNIATSQIPLPTALGDSCLSVNGAPVPLLYVSNKQINAQLPFNVTGNATMNIHSPAGISNNYYFTVLPTAPSVFRSGAVGPLTGLATIVRNDNSQFVTPTNPLHSGDSITIYLTGMGATTPQVTAGLPAPSSPLAEASAQPSVTLGGTSLNVSYAGLAPGEVGVYQINASIPSGVTQGLTIPLVISQGGNTTEIEVRVVK